MGVESIPCSLLPCSIKMCATVRVFYLRGLLLGPSLFLAALISSILAFCYFIQINFIQVAYQASVAGTYRSQCFFLWLDSDSPSNYCFLPGLTGLITQIFNSATLPLLIDHVIPCLLFIRSQQFVVLCVRLVGGVIESTTFRCAC